MSKVIISCAVTGAVHTPTMSPHLPITPREIANQAIAKGARVLWGQLGVIDLDAGRRAQAAGLTVVMDRCPAIEYRRFFQ